ncbi:uncharacterized protein [Typha latifolia]|uniref:uncharacterized protein n=1 Tax=Typha latifolia TaxID=4733 RepID=UPI003C306ABB
MSLFNHCDLFAPPLSPHFPSSFHPFDYYADDCLALDLLNPGPFDLLCPIDPFAAPDLASFRCFRERAETEFCLRSLADRVTTLELGLGFHGDVDRKYKWKAEIKGDRKYKWKAEVKAKGSGENSVKWTKTIEGGRVDGGDVKYTWTEKRKGLGEKSVRSAEIDGKKKRKENACTSRVVEIGDGNPGPIVMKKSFARRCDKGKQRELSPQDAALLIQMNFRAHLARRSQVLRCLRDLAIAKGKLKEIRALFCNFSYRRRIANDAEERQRFAERIIVLLLTVDALEGTNYMVRAARKSMIEELEMMLEVVDPQPPGNLRSLRHRRFNLPDGGSISRVMTSGVAEIVEMLG